MKTRLLSLFVLSLFGIQASFAQSKITGQVLDESSEPLIGASVKVKGTTIGMPTDINGNFQLDVAPGSTLEVSYLGYATRYNSYYLFTYWRVHDSGDNNNNFKWNISANLSLDRNKVTKLYSGVERILNGTDRQGNIFIGESLSNIYTYKCGGIANENNRALWENIDFNGRTVGLGDLFALDISGPDGKPDGVVDAYDRYIYGNTDPKAYGGFSTDLSWKGLTLNAVFNYSVGVLR